MAIKSWRERIAAIAIAAMVLLLLTASIRGADSPTSLEVAYAGSMGSMMDAGSAPRSRKRSAPSCAAGLRARPAWPI